MCVTLRRLQKLHLLLAANVALLHLRGRGKWSLYRYLQWRTKGQVTSNKEHCRFFMVTFKIIMWSYATKVRIMIFQVCDTAWFLGYLQAFRRYVLPISKQRFKNKEYCSKQGRAQTSATSRYFPECNVPVCVVTFMFCVRVLKARKT